MGVIVNASRSVLYPPVVAGDDWQAGVRRAAESFAGDLRTLVV